MRGSDGCGAAPALRASYRIQELRRSRKRFWTERVVCPDLRIECPECGVRVEGCPRTVGIHQCVENKQETQSVVRKAPGVGNGCREDRFRARGRTPSGKPSEKRGVGGWSQRCRDNSRDPARCSGEPEGGETGHWGSGKARFIGFRLFQESPLYGLSPAEEKGLYPRGYPPADAIAVCRTKTECFQISGLTVIEAWRTVTRGRGCAGCLSRNRFGCSSANENSRKRIPSTWSTTG